MPLLCHSYKARNRFSQPSPKSGRTAGDRSSLTDLGRNHLCQCIDLGPLEYRSESINCCYFQPPSVWHFVTLGYCAQLLSHVWLFVTSWTLAQQAPLFNPGLNPCLLHWLLDYLPVSHLRSPICKGHHAKYQDNHKSESKLPGEILTTSDIQIIPL